MKQPNFRMIQISTNNRSSNLSKAEKLFNKLTKKIEEKRNELSAWQNVIPAYQQKYISQFLPLKKSFDEYRIQIVRLLDKVFIDKALSKKDREKISDIIASITAELALEGNDGNLKEIYNKYSKSDFDAELNESEDMMKEMMAEMFGIELGDEFDIRSPEASMAHIGRKLQQKIVEDEELRQQRMEEHSKRKKSAKVLEKEARQQEEAKNISQSIREVYRKLSSVLHPDRETDAVEREKKTALMQRANVAYDNKDLLGLLELQLEIEQINEKALNNITEDRLKHYNKILADQLNELKDEIQAVEFSFGMRFNIPPEEIPLPETAIDELEEDIQDAQDSIASIKSDLALFQDVKNIKTWLKGYRLAPRNRLEEDLFGGW